MFDNMRCCCCYPSAAHSSAVQFQAFLLTLFDQSIWPAHQHPKKRKQKYEREYFYEVYIVLYIGYV